MKIIKISKCEECKHFMYKGSGCQPYCNKENRDIFPVKPIPKWCPLEEFKE